jgi:putative flavoprotein involved in K+ transport
MTRLPAMTYGGDDPNGFMTMPQVVDFVDAYAAAIDAPVHTNTRVKRVSRTDAGYVVTTNRDVLTCASVVIATGPANRANVPSIAAAIPRSVAMVTPLTYRSPASLDDSGVLVVGASASGVQLADEIHRSGRPVTISVGEHVRLPRVYRGRDIFWWMDSAGVLTESYDEMDDLVRARHVPSPQLVGAHGRSLDLNTLADLGVEVVGRLGGWRDNVAQFSGGLANTCRLADLKMNRLLDRFDRWANSFPNDIAVPADRRTATRTSPDAPLEVDVFKRGIRTIVWATGFRPDYSWLDVPVVDRNGRIRHNGGVVDESPGLYLLGGNLLRTRRSSYIAGAEADSDNVAAHLHQHLGRYRLTGSSLRSVEGPIAVLQEQQ